MRILLIDNHSTFKPNLLKLLAGQDVEVRDFQSENKAENYDLIILSGGHGLPVIGNEKFYQQELELIKNVKTPLLGICLGCELIASAYESKLERLPEKVTGVQKIAKLIDDPIFANMKVSSWEVYESHRWAISELGPELIGLAKSDSGFEIIRHREKAIYGFQFHPEMLVEQTLGDEMLRNIIKTTSHQ